MFGDAAERGPVARRQTQIRGGQHAEERADVVGEGELERAVGQSLRAGDRGRGRKLWP